MKEGRIFNIQRFCTDDGEGIRTTVFFKGCPLSCVWCHNPESARLAADIMYSGEKCIGCGNCVRVCPKGAHRFDDEGYHVFDRSRCVSCGKCTEVCHALALEFCGKTVTSDEVIKEVLKDRDFFTQSGGGMTLSGGEPFFQPEFALEVLESAKAERINTCVETCGYAKTEYYNRALECTDTFLFDIKLTDKEKHKYYTGADNDLILKNIRMLSGNGAKIVMRCPIIPDINFNEEHFDGICRLASELDGVIKVELLPYHPLGISKLARLGKTGRYDNKEFLAPNLLFEYAAGMTEKCGKSVTVR